MLFFVLLLGFIPFVLPIVNIVMVAGLKGRLRLVEDALAQQERAVEELTKKLRELTRTRVATAPPAATAPSAQTAAPPVHPVAPAPEPAPAPPPVAPAPPVAVAPPQPIAAAADRAPAPAAETPSPGLPPPQPPLAPPPADVAAPAREPLRKPIRPRPPEPPIAPPEPPPPPPQPFDWERLIGVKMFSAVAGIALVLAAVFFLRYSIDRGWLGPPIRVAIGILTGVALLVVCDLKAARKYPATANAMDAAAIAILFSTFFAAHALWHLIPATAAFALLALVTAVAVLLSIRRDSLFIAVLGLLGGFATPMLLSTGENRPVPLFAYVLLLNIGLAAVAYRKRWSLLTILTLVFTTLYQWGWVIKFLTASQLSLAMGIFLVFAAAGFASLMLGASAAQEETEGRSLEGMGLAAAVMPLLFVIYLAAVPAYGARPGLLFGFLLIVNVGLAAVTLVRRDGIAHAVGAAAAVLVPMIWLALSYAAGAWTIAVGFTMAFVALYALAPMAADAWSRPFTGLAARAVYAAPVLLFVFPVLARIEPAADSPAGLFSALFVLLALLAWRAMATEAFGIYFIAAFFGMAAEASWSAMYLTADRVRAGVALYAAFGVFYIGVPVVARRIGRAIRPAWGGGAVLIVSLFLLLFLAGGTRPASLWGLAVLLAILDAGIFVESAAGGLPAISFVGGALSWVVLASWWQSAADAIGLLPSLLFLVGLTLLMLGGHAWAYRTNPELPADPLRPLGFRHGTYLALVGHVFLFFIAVDPDRSVPPWPLFGALAVLTLAMTASSLAVHGPELHLAGAVAAAVIVYAWAQAATIAWAPVMLIAGEAAAAYALAWMARSRSDASSLRARLGAAAAVAALFLAELTLVDASAARTPLPVGLIAGVHAVNLAAILAIAWMQEWPFVAPAAVIPAWIATVSWQDGHAAPAEWTSLLLLAFVMYAVFAAYPFVLGERTRESRDPFLTAVVGSAMFFFAGRGALAQGHLNQYVGAIPVGEAVVLALLLRRLLTLQPAGDRDLGRLALVAGAALAFATVAIPLQLSHQWITIGWALEGAALAWAYRRIPHRGLLYWGFTLLAIVFVRLALNPAVFVYEPRGMRVFNWYLYAYVVCAVSMFFATWWYRQTDDEVISGWPRASALLPAAGVILLFIVLNIEIADYYAAGPEVTLRFGVTLAQDLTYTIGWLVFGLLLLAACIYLHNRPGRIAAIVLIAITAFKAFLYDMGSLGGLYRVFSLVGLAISLSLVALALQKYVMRDRS